MLAAVMVVRNGELAKDYRDSEVTGQAATMAKLIKDSLQASQDL